MFTPQSVLREGACLICADDSGGPKGFHAFQVFDQSVLLRHPFARHGQAERHSWQQSFRHIGHDDPDGKNQTANDAIADRNGQGKETGAEEYGDEAYDLDEVPQLCMDGRFMRIRGLGQLNNAAHLGCHSGFDDDNLSFAVLNQRARKHHLGAFQFRRSGFVCVQQLRLAFPGQTRIVNLQLTGRDQTPVGRDPIPFDQDDHVARHQILGGNLLRAAIAESRDHGRHQFFETVHDAFALVLLKVGERSVEQHHPQERDGDVKIALSGIHPLGGHGQRPANNEQDCKEILKLKQELNDFRCVFADLQFVATDLIQPFLCSRIG